MTFSFHLMMIWCRGAMWCILCTHWDYGTSIGEAMRIEDEGEKLLHCVHVCVPKSMNYFSTWESS